MRLCSAAGDGVEESSEICLLADLNIDLKTERSVLWREDTWRGTVGMDPDGSREQIEVLKLIIFTIFKVI